MRTSPVHFTFSALSLLMALSATTATAQTSAPQVSALKAAAERALATSPEVAARFNAYRAASDAVDVGQSAFRPKLDLTANVGRDRDRITSRAPESQSLNRSGIALSATQLLWDGLGTRNEVSRLGHDKLTRYFEFLDVTEQTALEAVRAHIDVQRYRRLVKLAEDNYVQHKYASLQIQSRVKAGVGRGVDAEQANARLALAESNLVTETANLHDVTARYQRVVGSAPSAETTGIGNTSLAMPASAEEVAATAIKQSSSISASIEALRAARRSADARQSAFQPRVEARLRGGVGNNFDGIRDQRNDTTAEIVMNWNLYNGGGDQARVRQQANVLTQAGDLRDKACRDTRQTAVIAYNDTRKLTEQLVYLDRNTLSIEKARDAYRQQFDIGQRSLLDLLNAENEVYTAKRAYTNAEADLGLAQMRTHAGMNQLTTQLGLARPTGNNGTDETAGWAAGDDAPAARCPVLVADVKASDKGELDVRAQRIAASVAPLPAPVVAPAPAPAPVMSTAPAPVTKSKAKSKKSKRAKKQ
jgi:outer membrane protein, adhesin transport system